MCGLRKLLCVVTCVGLAFSLYGCGGGGGKPPEGPQQVEPPPVEPPPSKDDEKKILIAKKRTELDNTEWEISVTPRSGTNKQPKSDTLRFVDKKFYSVAFDSQGYHASNYSLRVQGERAVWETMQTKEGEGVVFWRGDWRGDRMTGIISRHPNEGEKESFRFVSTGSREIKEEAPPGREIKETAPSKEVKESPPGKEIKETAPVG